ncbi:MAG: hypothetical protein NT169_19570 [Chloroflexi bacterium]|nr:hypothetical protein [Chloroflexota bacterium]MCX6915785.1 hypothetical protein [Verrucomicrobiota bacterium]
MGIARDVAIIILALESIIIGVLLAVLVIQVIRLVKLLREEVLPILNSTQETVGTVRGTATFMTDHLVQPVVKVSSYAAGARQAVSTLFGRGGRNGRSQA